MTPRPTVRRLALGLVAVLALAVPAACSSDGTESASGGELRRFTVVLDWTPNTNHAGMYLAQAEGWYADAGLDVQFVEPGETSSLQALAAGRADVAVSVAEELLPARAEGLPVRSIAAVIEHNTSSLVSLASNDITEPADLEGATYGG
ncbi:MAG: ABC transporter substrate-binding protein, partial [Acidimicrobiales bacterium]|nr:ABC transporter substrate-binding protein [Acidimicrobiales bacterium]